MKNAANDCAHSKMWAEPVVDHPSFFSITKYHVLPTRYDSLLLEHVTPISIPCSRVGHVLTSVWSRFGSSLDHEKSASSIGCYQTRRQNHPYNLICTCVSPRCL
jgi:hypothetical protein